MMGGASRPQSVGSGKQEVSEDFKDGDLLVKYANIVSQNR